MPCGERSAGTETVRLMLDAIPGLVLGSGAGRRQRRAPCPRARGRLQGRLYTSARMAIQVATTRKPENSMSEPYNRFSGQSLERLTALTDGLFAVAMTLLVLDLRVPLGAANSAHLWHSVIKLGPSFAAYL